MTVETWNIMVPWHYCLTGQHQTKIHVTPITNIMPLSLDTAVDVMLAIETQVLKYTIQQLITGKLGAVEILTVCCKSLPLVDVLTCCGEYNTHRLYKTHGKCFASCSHCTVQKAKNIQDTAILQCWRHLEPEPVGNCTPCPCIFLIPSTSQVAIMKFHPVFAASNN